MADTDSPIAKALANITQSEADLRVCRAVLNAHKKQINKLLHKLAGCDDLHVYASASDVQVTGNMMNLDGFKAQRLMRTLAEFSGDEWTARSHEYPGSLNIDYFFTMPSPERDKLPSMAEYGVIRVKVAAYVRSDSPTCKKVLVGKRRTTSVEKQYRIECN